MNSDEQKAMMARFIREHDLIVVSSIWQGAPQAAAVRYSEMNDFEIIFATFNSTRKYRNIKKEPRIAIVVIGHHDETVTIQMEGVAVEQGGSQSRECQKVHLAKNPGSARYAEAEEQRYFKVVPEWIRYTDIAQEPELVFEVYFQ